jgi:hypothetical protein
MNLIKQYEQELKERKLQSIELGDDENSFINGIIVQLERTINDLKKQALNDRFFLEEIVYKIKNGETDHYETLTRDFLKEYVNNLPMTEFDREQYIENVLGNSELDYYFESEKQLAFFLKNNRLPNKEDLMDYSIVDCSSQAEH